WHNSLLSSVQVEGRCSDTETGGFITESGGSLSSPLALLGTSGPALPDTNCPRLPAMRFDYSHVEGVLGDGAAIGPVLSDGAGLNFEAFDERVIDLSSSPDHSLDEALTTLMDVNRDSLPDVLVTAAGLFGGQHG